MPAETPWRLLVLGGTGAIGGSIVETAAGRGWDVVATSRRAAGGGVMAYPRLLRYDPLLDFPAEALAGEAPFDSVCWAHGANATDSVETFDASAHLALYEANCLSILVSSQRLMAAGLLRPEGARLVMVSSIWQERARQNKLSYTVTKAAVGGIIRSLAVDLGSRGYLVNAVLPGVLQTPMTAANLSTDQIDLIKEKTTAGKLPEVETVAETVVFLCSMANTSISGQSLAIDLGMSNASLV